MKRFFQTLTAGFILWAGVSTALAVDSKAGHAGNLGAGVMVGAPTGLTVKYWATDMFAFDGAAAWHFGSDDRLQLHGDALWHYLLPGINPSEGVLPVYIGAGFRVLAGHDSTGGIRIPIGISYLFAGAPLEAFAEVAPVVEFAPDTDADVDGGIGLRVYFK
jgi:hypothetical protein